MLPYILDPEIEVKEIVLGSILQRKFPPYFYYTLVLSILIGWKNLISQSDSLKQVYYKFKIPTHTLVAFTGGHNC